MQKAIRKYFVGATVIGPSQISSAIIFLSNVLQYPHHCSVLAIAHRLHTIADYSRILVIENGGLKESGTPAALAEDPNSHFAQLIKASGKTEAAILREMMTSTKTTKPKFATRVYDSTSRSSSSNSEEVAAKEVQEGEEMSTVNSTEGSEPSQVEEEEVSYSYASNSQGDF